MLVSFLENRLTDKGKLLGLCQLHPDFKPLVCSLAPLGREVSFKDGMWNMLQENWNFVEPIEGCPGCRVEEKTSIRSSIQSLGSELEQETQYYEILERLQKNEAGIRAYEELHYSLTANQSMEEYLRMWRENTISDGS